MPGKKILIILIFILLFGGIYYFRQKIYVTYVDVILDNRYHGVACENLPSVSDVERVLVEKENLVNRIKSVRPGEDENHSYISVDTNEPCVNKGEIMISYPSHDDRVKIEMILKDDSFDGIPYNLINN